MRLVLVIAIWIVIVGGVWFYIDQRDSRIIDKAEAQQSYQQVVDDFTLELTPTFGIESDPFALQTETAASALLVRLRGQDIYNSDATLARGETLRIGPLHDFVSGNNELYLEASPPLNESSISHALRVRLLRGETAVLDETLWADAGSKIAGNLPFVLKQEKDNHDDH